MGKQPGNPGLPSPRKRKGRGQEQAQSQEIHTPTKENGPSMQCSTPSMATRAGSTPPRAAECTTNNADKLLPAPATGTFQTWEGTNSMLREAIVDGRSKAAALVPLRPSLRRIKDDLVRILDETVSSHNGNASILIHGPPGTGKTLAVERAIQEVCTKHNDPTGSGSSATNPTSTSAAVPATSNTTNTAVRNVGVVRLNGLLQPDERTAFQEVAKQLCREFGQKFVKSATFDDNLVFLKGMLHALYKCLKKVVFIVDEFQQYANKGKQQMLYYLLDMLQDSKIQAAVIGVSSVHNIVEDLEKRVLSRVGRRRMLVTFPAISLEEMGDGASSSPGGGAAQSPGAAAGGGVDSYEGLLYDMLALHAGMADLAGLSPAAAAAHNAGVTRALKDIRIANCISKLALIGAPPQHVALAAEAALAAWGDDLRRQRVMAAAAVDAGQQARHGAGPPPSLGVGHLLTGLGGVLDMPERALVDAVRGLPVISLVLLVAAHRLLQKGQQLCNFEMAWDEYRSINAQRGAIAFSKQAAAAAWQTLPLSGLAHFADTNVESRGRDLSYAGVVLLVGYSDLDRGIREHPHCPDAVQKFYLQEI
ncbi:hypothetical protein VaNZ11_007121 [Volvox africanus]|uniref:Origin recognition complex subunit 4 n=1 Tax=Volvox africanus TaxID=51714 RepID=A0ABQ5S271_9CHLO|nr:hypothetical protein VaNZ11_007121 [Volvox africanus]